MDGDETTDTDALELSLAFSLWHQRKLLQTRTDQRNRFEAYKMASPRGVEPLFPA